MNNSTLDIIKTIIDKQLNMPAGRVFAYNGTQDLPKDKDLFIVLAYGDRNPYSNNFRYKSTNDGLVEILTQNYIEEIIISLCSVNTSARERAVEVAPALSISSYSQYIQEKNKIHITNIQPVRDMSFLEETTRLNRFDIYCSVYRAYETEHLIDYYDRFPNTSKLEANFYIEK